MEIKGNEVGKAWECECKSQVETVNRFLSKKDIGTEMAIYKLGRTPRGERSHESIYKNLHLKACLSNKMCSDKEQTET